MSAPATSGSVSTGPSPPRAVEQLKGNGVEFSGGVSEHPWGRIAPFKDADGNDLQVYEPELREANERLEEQIEGG